MISGPCVHDASAVLAMLRGEPGASRVETLLSGSVISTVNWAEVIGRSVARGVDTDGLAYELMGSGLKIAPFDLAEAERCGRLWSETWRLGLSLADRACLATALVRDLPVLTADRAWNDLDIGIPIESIH